MQLCFAISRDYKPGIVSVLEPSCKINLKWCRRYMNQLCFFYNDLLFKITILCVFLKNGTISSVFSGNGMCVSEGNKRMVSLPVHNAFKVLLLVDNCIGTFAHAGDEESLSKSCHNRSDTYLLSLYYRTGTIYYRTLYNIVNRNIDGKPQCRYRMQLCVA